MVKKIKQKEYWDIYLIEFSVRPLEIYSDDKKITPNVGKEIRMRISSTFRKYRH